MNNYHVISEGYEIGKNLQCGAQILRGHEINYLNADPFNLAACEEKQKPAKSYVGIDHILRRYNGGGPKCGDSNYNYVELVLSGGIISYEEGKEVVKNPIISHDEWRTFITELDEKETNDREDNNEDGVIGNPLIVDENGDRTNDYCEEN